MNSNLEPIASQNSTINDIQSALVKVFNNSPLSFQIPRPPRSEHSQGNPFKRITLTKWQVGAVVIFLLF